MKSSLVTAGALALATVALSIVPALPAAASALPSGDDMYTISWDDNPGQLYSVDASSAITTPIGEGLTEAPNPGPNPEDIEDTYTLGAAHDPSSDTVYFVQVFEMEWQSDRWLESWLGVMDLSTGHSELIAPFDDDLEVVSLAISPDGSAYTIAGDTMNFSGALYSVDLETAELHRVNYEADGELVTAFAYSLSADGFYAVGQTGSVYSVNVGTGEFTQIGELAIEDLTDGSSPGVTALQFDLTGTAWLVVQTDEYESLLVAFLMGPENPDFVVIGEFEGYDAEYDEGWDVSTYSLVITNDADTNRKTSTDAKLFVFGDDENYNGLQLFRVDPTTGFALPVGTGNGHLNGDDGTWHTASQPAYDPVTKKVYFVEHTGAFPDGQHFFLNRLDPATGEATRIGEFNFEGSTEVEVNAFAIGSDGSAYAFAWPESSSGYLYSVNLATAELEHIWDSPFEFITEAFAADPVSGKFYAIDAYTGALFEVNLTPDAPADDRLEFVAIVTTESNGDGDGVTGMQIDGDRTFWILNKASVDPDGSGPIEEADWDYLNSFSLDDIEGEEPPYIEATQHGLLTDDPFAAAGLLLLPAATAAGPGGLLAITGADSDAGVVAAILLLLAGAGLVLLRRRRTATN